MAKLNDDEQKALDDLLAKKDAPDEPAGGGSSRVENVNITVDLNDETQVKRAVRSGLLPKSYLEDDDDEGDGDGDGDDDEGRAAKKKTDDAPRRRLDTRY